jgi:hypothetical protein
LPIVPYPFIATLITIVSQSLCHGRISINKSYYDHD